MDVEKKLICSLLEALTNVASLAGLDFFLLFGSNVGASRRYAGTDNLCFQFLKNQLIPKPSDKNLSNEDTVIGKDDDKNRVRTDENSFTNNITIESLEIATFKDSKIKTESNSVEDIIRKEREDLNQRQGRLKRKYTKRKTQMVALKPEDKNERQNRQMVTVTTEDRSEDKNERQMVAVTTEDRSEDENERQKKTKGRRDDRIRK